MSEPDAASARHYRWEGLTMRRCAVLPGVEAALENFVLPERGDSRGVTGRGLRGRGAPLR